MAAMQQSSFNPIDAYGETPHTANICASARPNYDSSQNDLRVFVTIRRGQAGHGQCRRSRHREIEMKWPRRSAFARYRG
jgi:hypothetical protein